MPRFSDKSLMQLSTCNHRIREVFNEAIDLYDFTVLEGRRDEERQEKMVEEGKSKVHYPDSKHNNRPSDAVDVAPYPIDWGNRGRFFYLAGLVLAIAAQKGYRFRWGGDWNMNGDFEDQSFDDLPHFEDVTDERSQGR